MNSPIENNEFQPSEWPLLEVGDFVKVKVDRISNSGNAIALTPRNGDIFVKNGEVGEEVVVKITGNNGNLQAVKVEGVPEHLNIPSETFYEMVVISLDEFYEFVKEHRRQEKEREEQLEGKKSKLNSQSSGKSTPKKFRSEDKKLENKKSKKEREKENLNRALKGYR
ncbi:TRAM domain-containing protein [Natronolimnohabitans sp. A-GB9]|uniref:TRAM domain-containing protein n=1 Tax=Natronolimnohabitans sp. A-GB9 TaxID=3069757 RepID=UPI0027B3FAE2|nr:TRAM domain-containing protein [Natronolimnohabitans sp. A-GB9]MDQ2052879.1 TRAM domain-containing protein [Natronolimnohabitans sp. A-GB9]